MTTLRTPDHFGKKLTHEQIVKFKKEWEEKFKGPLKSKMSPTIEKGGHLIIIGTPKK